LGEVAVLEKFFEINGQAMPVTHEKAVRQIGEFDGVVLENTGFQASRWAMASMTVIGRFSVNTPCSRLAKQQVLFAGDADGVMMTWGAR